MTRRCLLAGVLSTSAGCGGCNGDDLPLPPEPEPVQHLLVLVPGDGDVFAGSPEVLATALTPDVSRMTVSAGGSQLAEAPVAAGRLRAEIDATALAVGNVTLTITALDTAGSPLEDHTITVLAVPIPTPTATIGPSGGALMTPNGVVVTIHPRALSSPRDFLVRDRDPMTLPASVRARPIDILGAIDFLDGDGTIHDDLFLERPADIQFPGIPPQPSRQGGEELMIAAVRSDANNDGEPELTTVSAGSRSNADFVTTFTPPLPRISDVQNLTEPDGDLRPYDLVELSGDNLAGDLRIRIGTSVVDTTFPTPDGRLAHFTVPEDIVPGETDLTVFNRFSPGTDSRRVRIAARPVENLSAAEADRRINVLFDGLDAALDNLQQWVINEAPTEPRWARWQSARDSFETDFGSPLGNWRTVLGTYRAHLLGSPAAARIDVGRVLVTMESTVATLSAPVPGALNEFGVAACLGMYAFGGYMWWLGKMTQVPTSRLDVLGSYLLGDATNLWWKMMNDVGCQVPWLNGVRGHECDLVVRAQNAGFDAGLSGRVAGVETVNVGGTDIVNVVPLGGVHSDSTGSYLESVSASDGRGDLDFVEAATTIDVVVTDPAGMMTTVSVPTPRSDVREHMVTFIPATNTLSAGTWTLRLGLEVGLSQMSDPWKNVVPGDFDGDGNVDFFVNGVPTRLAMPVDTVRLSYFAQGAGDGTFTVVEPVVPDDPMAATTPFEAIDISDAVDIDLDGDLDLVSVRANTIGQPDDIIDLWENTGGFNFNTRTVLSDTDPNCPGVTIAESSIAIGDFDGGSGPDILVVTGAGGAAGPGERCLLTNDGSGAFTSASQARTGVSATEPHFGAVADLDGDGSLDAWLARQGVVLFGDGTGSFTEVNIPMTCFNAAQLTEPRSSKTQRPGFIDWDADGTLELLTWSELTFTMTGVAYAMCALDVATNRTISEDAALQVIPSMAALVKNFGVVDVDLDGVEDVIGVADIPAGWVTAYHRGAGLVADPILTEMRMGEVIATAYADADGDGRTDIFSAALAMTGGPGPDAFLRNTVAMPGNYVRVTVRNPSLGVSAPGAVIQIDADGNGDFSSAGQLLTRPARSVTQSIGIGTATMVDVRVVFVDTGAAGGNIATTLGVAAGAMVVVDDPQ